MNFKKKIFISFILLYSFNTQASWAYKIFHTSKNFIFKPNLRWTTQKTFLKNLETNQSKLILGLRCSYDSFPPQNRFSYEEFPALRRIGVSSLTQKVPSFFLYDFFLPKDLVAFDSLENNLKKAIDEAPEIVINCEGIDPLRFKPSFKAEEYGEITSFELTYLFKIYYSENQKKITWIKGPAKSNWINSKTNYDKLENWWQGVKKAKPWCHKLIKQKIKLALKGYLND